jgi:hypothetical protein
LKRDRQKGQFIEQFSQNMVKCEIRFDKDEALFFATHATVRFEAPTLPEVRTLLQRHARKYQPVTWEKVILVSTGWVTEETHHNAIGTVNGEARVHRELTIEWFVYERAKAPREKGDEGEAWYVRSAFPHPEHLRYREENPFYGVQRQWHDLGANETVIPFSEEALRSLETIGVALQQLKDRLSTLLSSKNASHFLNAGVTLGRLLGAGEAP